MHQEDLMQHVLEDISSDMQNQMTAAIVTACCEKLGIATTIEKKNEDGTVETVPVDVPYVSRLLKEKNLRWQLDYEMDENRKPNVVIGFFLLESKKVLLLETNWSMSLNEVKNA